MITSALELESDRIQALLGDLAVVHTSPVLGLNELTAGTPVVILAAPDITPETEVIYECDWEVWLGYPVIDLDESTRFFSKVLKKLLPLGYEKARAEMMEAKNKQFYAYALNYKTSYQLGDDEDEQD